MRENTKEIRKAYEPPEKMVKDTSIETMAFMEPKIPKGFEYVNGKWKSGFRCTAPARRGRGCTAPGRLPGRRRARPAARRI